MDAWKFKGLVVVTVLAVELNKPFFFPFKPLQKSCNIITLINVVHALITFLIWSHGNSYTI